MGFTPQTEEGGGSALNLRLHALFRSLGAAMVVVMTVPVVMVMVVIVVMVMVVIVAMMVMVAVGINVKLFGLHLLFRHLGQFEDEIDGLVFEDRRPELGEELGVVAVVVVDLALLAGELAHALEQGPAHLLVGDGDLVAGADFRQDQSEPDAAGGKIAIFLARLVLGHAFVLESPFAAFEIGLHLLPNRIELVLDQRRGKLEAMALVQSVEQRALYPQPRHPGPLLLHPLLNCLAQFLD